MKKLLVFLLFVSLGLGLTSCTDKKTETKPETKPTITAPETDVTVPETTPTVPEVVETVTPKTEVHEREDDRADAYVVYASDGTEVSKHASLYEAINVCVNEGDSNDYVTKVGDATKLFINYDKFAEDSQDMFWYYENGTSLEQYTAWAGTYWQDLRDAGNVVSVFKEAATGIVQYYANSHVVINPNSDSAVGAGSTAVWNACWNLEASATVDMQAYSGITKSVYTIDLSEAKIYPAYAGGDKAYAYVGFITADSYNTSNLGLRCDTTTGNWYYYAGETTYNTETIEIDTDNCYLTSTWDAEAGCFRPDGDVTLTMEELTLVDDEGDSYIVHRVTMDFGNDRVVSKDYEIASLTQCGTIRFTSGLDIVSENTLPDYMCGAKFENLVVTSAQATVYEEMQDILNYGSVPTLATGVYDILNSNPETAARFHTIVYNPASVKADFSVAGKDVYSYSFEYDATAPAYASEIVEVNELIAAIPADVTEEARSAVEAAREAYDALKIDAKKQFVVGYEKLTEAEIALGITEKLIDVTLTPDFINQDVSLEGNAFSIWTEAGMKVRSLTKNEDGSYNAHAWVAGPWRYYVVFDAQGRICYAVYNPESGYGTPNETSYYVDEFYSDYTKNPAIVLHEGFAGWVAGQTNHNLYEIVIPEGGYALSGHGSGANLLAATLSGNVVTDCSEAALNNNTVFDANIIRLSYDVENNALRIYELTETKSTLTVNVVESTLLPDGNNIGVYTTSGTIIRDLTTNEDGSFASYSWLDGPWRLYIVLDADGKICYVVLNADNGYGCPTDPFYSNEKYNDYTKNPAIVLFDGFSGWVAGQTNHNLYEIVIPEGGTLVMAHGSGCDAIVNSLSCGSMTSAADAAVNAKNAFAGEITMIYDAENGVINVSVIK